MALDKLNSRKYRAHRDRVLKMHGRICAYCGTDEGEMHVDHIIPRKAGGDHSMDNLQVLCKSCNLRKATKSEGVFLAHTATPPVFSSCISPKTTSTVQAGPMSGQPKPKI